MTVLESLVCPRCGAPLSLAPGVTAAICHYCNSALRVGPSPREPATAPVVGPTGVTPDPTSSLAPGRTVVTADPSISSAAVTRVKQLLLLGKRDDAIALYAEEAHCERATATATVNEYAVDDMWSVMGRLNAAGMVIATGFVMLLASSIALGITGGVSWTTAAWMGGPAAAFIVFEGSRFLRTLHYFFARAGAATVVRFALIGKNAGNDALFRLLLEVREPQGSTFRTEINCVLGDEDAAAMKEGYRVRVRYFRGDPTSVLYK